MTEYTDVATVGQEQGGQQSDESGFAGTVGPEDAEDLAFGDGERDVVDGDDDGFVITGRPGPIGLAIPILAAVGAGQTPYKALSEGGFLPAEILVCFVYADRFNHNCLLA